MRLALCHYCGTTISFRLGVGWVHDRGFQYRGGCGNPTPEGKQEPHDA